jgi:hypothetical protein
MDQTIINFIFGACGALLGAVLKATWDAVQDLRKQVGAIEVLVAGEYVKRSEFKELSQAIFAKLDLIVEKLDKKADK